MQTVLRRPTPTAATSLPVGNVQSRAGVRAWAIVGAIVLCFEVFVLVRWVAGLTSRGYPLGRRLCPAG